MDITCSDHHSSAFNLLLRAAETLLLFTINMELLLFQIKYCCYLILALKGFKSLTSAWHLEYFKIPLSKKKYLCKQEMKRVKRKRLHEQPKKPTKTHHLKHPHTFIQRTFFPALNSPTPPPPVTPHSVCHIYIAPGIHTDIALYSYTLCQPFKGHFLFFSKQPSCFCGSWVQFIAPRSPSTISQLSCLNRKYKSRSCFFQLTELLRQIQEE